MTEKKCVWNFYPESALSNYQVSFETSCHHFDTYFAKIKSSQGETGIKLCPYCGGHIEINND